MMKTTTPIAFVLLFTSIWGAGCNRPSSEGPSINDLFGVFEVIDSLQLTNVSPDFSSGESVGFSCKFSKPVEWNLLITGLESGSRKTFEAFSSELFAEQIVWYGNCDDVPFFMEETCEVRLSVEGEEEEYVAALQVAGVKTYSGIEVATFDVGLPDGALVWHQDGGNMTFELAQENALQGNQCFKMGGRVNWDWSLGYIDIPIELNDVNASAEDFFLNVGVFGGMDDQFATDQYVNILLSESNAPFNDDVNNNAADIFGTGSEVYKHQIRPVDWEGWRYFAIPYSEFEVKSEGGNNVREPSEIRGIRLGLQACPFNSGNCPDNGNIEAQADVDYIMFTEGLPLLEQE